MAYDLPITISDGDFSDPLSGTGTTPLAKIAVRLSEAVLNTTWDKASTLSATATAKANDLASDIDAIIAAPGDYHVAAGSVSVPTVTAPGVAIPSSIDTASIIATFDAKYPVIATFLKSKADDIISSYFANDSALYSAAETWISGAIANGGIPASVISQLISDDFARINSEKQRTLEAIPAMFAGRRFPLPPGAALSAVVQVEQKAQESMAESSRKLSVMAIENMKWSISQVKDLRQIAMNSMVSYIQAVGKEAVDSAASITGLGYGEQSRLISAAASFYGADTNAKEMMSKVAQFNATLAFQGQEKNQMANLQLFEGKEKALIAELQLIMQQATAMLNNLHASAGTTLSV